MVALLKPPITDLVNRAKIVNHNPEVSLVGNRQERVVLRENFIKHTPLFAELAEIEQQTLAGWMQPVHYKPDETIFEKDCQSDALYLIEQGWVKLHTDDDNWMAVNRGPGSLLGEVDFLLGRPHTVTARTAGEVTLWMLDNNALTHLIAKQPQIGLNLGLALGTGIVQFQKLLADRLARFPLLQNVSEEERNAIARHLSPHHYLPRETVYRSGEPPTGIFFIQRGQVWLLGDTDGDYIELTDGEVFGEKGVISGAPHSRTAHVSTETIAWQLSPGDFAKLAHIYPALKTNLGQNLQYNLTEALTIASLIVDGEINALNVVSGSQSTLVKKLNGVSRMLTWLKNYHPLL